jgi:hypothetical protein
MKLISALGLLLLATAVHAQELDGRPDAPKTNNPTVPIAPNTFVQERIYPNTPIPDGMVWVPRGKVWHAEELNSCEWCAKPMTFKHAAFDKKMSSMFLLEIALTTADVELGQACIKTGRCREGNPFLGTGSRSLQYAIRLPAIVAAWMDSAWARKGDKRLHVGGMKHWYWLPLTMHAEAAIGIASGVGRK